METKKKTAKKRKVSEIDENIITITLFSSSEKVSLWLQQKGVDPNIFEDWDGQTIFGASLECLQRKCGNDDDGERLFFALNSLRSQSSAGQ